METRALIKNNFIKLYSKLDYNKITIKKLCESVPIARTTFYAHFNNIDEVKEEIENEAIKGIRTSCEEIYISNDKKYFMAAMNYIKENEDIFYAFLISQPNVRFIEKFKNEITNHFKDNFKINNSKNNDLELYIFASSIVAYYTYMLKHPNEIDFNDMSKKFELIKNSINLIL